MNLSTYLQAGEKRLNILARSEDPSIAHNNKAKVYNTSACMAITTVALSCISLISGSILAPLFSAVPIIALSLLVREVARRSLAASGLERPIGFGGISIFQRLWDVKSTEESPNSFFETAIRNIIGILAGKDLEKSREHASNIYKKCTKLAMGTTLAFTLIALLNPSPENLLLFGSAALFFWIARGAAYKSMEFINKQTVADAYDWNTNPDLIDLVSPIG